MKFRCLAVFGLAVVLCIPCLAADAVSARGIVVDPAGKPVSGVKVRAVLCPYTGKASVRAAAISGQDGRFELAALPKPKVGEYYGLVAFTPDEYLGWARSVGSLMGRQGGEPDPADGYRIIVSKPGVFEGRVVDEAGNPITGAEVTPFVLYDGSGPIKEDGPTPPAIDVNTLEAVVRIRPGTTDADGVFRLTGVPLHAQAPCFARKPGYATNSSAVGYGDPKRLVLLPGGSIAGVVVDARGKPVAGVELYASGERSGRGSGSAKTIANGSYVIDGLLPGSYYVKVWQAKDVVAKPVDDILVKAGQTTKVRRMVVTSGALLQIRVVDVETGKPVSGGYVSAYDPAASESTYTNGKIDSQGRSTLRLVPGAYQVYFHGDSTPRKYQPKTARGVTIPAAGVKNLVVKLRKSDIATGKVLDPNGKPLVGASVSVGAPWDSKTTTDASGRFTAIVPPAQNSAPG